MNQTTDDPTLADGTALVVRAATAADSVFIIEANAAMALETEQRRLDPAVLARGVAAVFAEPARGRYWVVEHDGIVVGCLLVTREWSDWRDGDWWWVQSVYVVPTARRVGAFRALYQHVEAAARATPGVIGLRLYVERDNRRAQQAYRALGMDETAYRLLERLFEREFAAR